VVHAHNCLVGVAGASGIIPVSKDAAVTIESRGGELWLQRSVRAAISTRGAMKAKSCSASCLRWQACLTHATTEAQDELVCLGVARDLAPFMTLVRGGDGARTCSASLWRPALFPCGSAPPVDVRMLVRYRDQNIEGDHATWSERPIGDAGVLDIERRIVGSNLKPWRSSVEVRPPTTDRLSTMVTSTPSVRAR
jgi:hypothetical protein